MRCFSDELKPYSEMKDSGVEWLDEVPAHWQVRRLKTLCLQSALYGANVTANLYATKGIRFLRTSDITDEGQLREGGVFLSEELVTDYVLADGDLLISRSGTIGRSFLYQSKTHGPCAYAGYLVRFCPRQDVLPNYLFLFTKTLNFAGFLRVMAISSTIENVNGEKYANCTLPLPPLPEQIAIARFLNHTDRKIQHYIQSKEKLIALLEEFRKSVIQETVTGKFDVRTGRPYPEYKDSGVEWLEEVPEHWEVRRLRNISTMRVSNVDKHSRDSEVPIRLCNYVDVYNNDYIGSDMPFMVATATSDEIERFRLQSGDVLITKDSEVWNDIGVPALVKEIEDDVVSGYHLALLRPNDQQINSGFLFRVLQSRDVGLQFHIRANGVTRYGLSHDAIKSVWMPVPPLSEQAAIATYLDKVTTGIGSAIQRAERQIQLFREYRTRLIADVVTGKLDVREAAARLPDTDPDNKPDENIPSCESTSSKHDEMLVVAENEN